MKKREASKRKPGERCVNRTARRIGKTSFGICPECGAKVRMPPITTKLAPITAFPHKVPEKRATTTEA